VDAYADGTLVGSDINEEAILNFIKKYSAAYIIITPIGGNGFIFGRGSKQFTPRVLESVGRSNIIIAGSPDKLTSLEALRVDTRDADLDMELSGYIDVVIGYKEIMKMELRC